MHVTAIIQVLSYRGIDWPFNYAKLNNLPMFFSNPLMASKDDSQLAFKKYEMTFQFVQCYLLKIFLR